MNKRLLAVIIVIILIIGGAAGYAIYQNKQKENKDDTEKSSNEVNENNDNGNEVKENNTTIGNQTEPNRGDTQENNKKTLVVYFSAQSHTKAVAEKIANNLDADIFEIVPEQEYTSEDLNYSNSNSRVSKEHDDESLRDIKLVKDTVDNFEDYDTVLIGYPIWWGIAAWTVDTFVKANDFSGKTVVPFCTSASSSLGQSGKLLEEEANSGNWLEGHRFSSNTLDSDIKNWTDSIK